MMHLFLCNRKPKASLFSICRYDGWRWFRRSVTWTAGIGGRGWFFGFLKHDFNETIIPLSGPKGGTVEAKGGARSTEALRATGYGPDE